MSHMNGSGCIVGHELLLQLDFSQLIRHSHKLINTYSEAVFQWLIIIYCMYSILMDKWIKLTASKTGLNLLVMCDWTLAKMCIFTTENEHGWS